MTVNKTRHEMNTPMKQRKMSATEEERAVAAAAVGQPESQADEPTQYATAQDISRANEARRDIIAGRTSASEEEQQLAQAVATGYSEVDTVSQISAGSPSTMGHLNTDGPDGPGTFGGDLNYFLAGVYHSTLGITPTHGIGLWLDSVQRDIVDFNANGSIGFAGPFGYGNPSAVGVGGTVTQLTSKATAVQIDKVCGFITLHNASLAANTAVSLSVANALVGYQDVIILNHQTGGTLGAYLYMVDAVYDGGFTLTIRNLTAGALAEAPRLSFAIIKGTTA